jgi:hypothetical protein
MAQSPPSALSEVERALAFERFELLRPALEGGVPLTRVARDRGIALIFTVIDSTTALALLPREGRLRAGTVQRWRTETTLPACKHALASRKYPSDR